MRRVRSADTRPEMRVRSLLHRLGFRFRLHRKDLPGKPDIVLPKHRTVVFVHGCFWHRHEDCRRASLPATRQDYWIPKFARTVERDRQNQDRLRQLGWRVILVWECEIKDAGKLAARLKREVPGEPLLYEAKTSPALMAAEDGEAYTVSRKAQGERGQ